MSLFLCMVLIYTQWFKQGKFNIKGLWNYNQRVAHSILKTIYVTLGLGQRVPKEGQVWKEDLLPKAEFRPHWRRWGCSPQHSREVCWCAWTGSGLLSLGQQGSNLRGGAGLPQSAHWHAEIAFQAQAEYRWALASGQGHQCAEGVKVPMRAGDLECTASMSRRMQESDHLGGLELRGCGGVIHAGFLVGAEHNPMFSHTHVTESAISENRRSPSACYVLLAPPAKKAQHPLCCKGEMFLGVPSFNTE